MLSNMRLLTGAVRRHRLRLLLTYSLFCIEMAGNLIRPFLLGLAVNDLLAGSYRGLVLLSGVHLAWLALGTFRHMYDTRTFTALYNDLVLPMLAQNRSRNNVSTLSAHAHLSRELVDFLESDLAYILEALYNILGSLVLLFFYESRVALICLFTLVPVFLIGRVYGRKMGALTRKRNDELEKQVGVIARGNKEEVKHHYGLLRKWQIRISDGEAWNFGTLELFVLVIIALSLIITSQTVAAGLLAGSMIGIYNYILKFVSGLENIPYVIQRYATLKDIASRIGENQNRDDAPPPLKPLLGLPYAPKEPVRLSA